MRTIILIFRPWLRCSYIKDRHRFSSKRLNIHLPRISVAHHTLALHTNPSPVRNSSLIRSSSRAQQILRHISTQISHKSVMNSLPMSDKGYHSNVPSAYGVRKMGAPNTLEHRIYIEKEGVPISPFHDIPLYANEQQTVLNMVVEIPRWTNAKMEVGSPRASSLPQAYPLSGS